MLEMCIECGKVNSSTKALCDECIASIKKATSTFDINHDGKVDLHDLRAAFQKIKDAVSSATKSQLEKDNASVEALSKDFENHQESEKNETEIMCDKFKAALESTIDLKFAEVMQAKQSEEKFLSYVDSQILTASIRNIFKTSLQITPPQVDAACRLSEAILAPSLQERKNLIKAAIGLAGGTAGIGLVVGGVGVALGWGTGLLATATALFVGSSFTGPIGWTLAGVSLAAMAGYFATTSNKETDTERFLKVLKSATTKAVDAVWPQHGEALSEAINPSMATGQGN
jgi:hypothetical protein